MKDLDHWMDRCLALAIEALPCDVPVGALVVLKGEVIGEGFNRREAEQDPTGHAELLALRQAAAHLGNWRLNGATVFVTLEPCPMCASALLQARVSRVVFGAFDPLAGACGSRYNLFADAPDVEVLGGVREEPCGTLLKNFFRGRGKDPLS